MHVAIKSQHYAQATKAAVHGIRLHSIKSMYVSMAVWCISRLATPVSMWRGCPVIVKRKRPNLSPHSSGCTIAIRHRCDSSVKTGGLWFGISSLFWMSSEIKHNLNTIIKPVKSYKEAIRSYAMWKHPKKGFENRAFSRKCHILVRFFLSYLWLKVSQNCIACLAYFIAKRSVTASSNQDQVGCTLWNDISRHGKEL